MALHALRPLAEGDGARLALGMALGVLDDRLRRVPARVEPAEDVGELAGGGDRDVAGPLAAHQAGDVADGDAGPGGGALDLLQQVGAAGGLLLQLLALGAAAGVADGDGRGHAGGLGHGGAGVKRFGVFKGEHGVRLLESNDIS